MVAGTTAWPSMWFGNKLLTRSPPLKELQWVERGSSAFFHAVVSSTVQVCQCVEWLFLLSPCLNKGRSFWLPVLLGEWKGLSLLCKSGLWKNMQEMWTCYSSKLELPLSWRFCSSRAGWLWSLALLLTCVSKFSFLQFFLSSDPGMTLIRLDAWIYFYVKLENTNTFF